MPAAIVAAGVLYFSASGQAGWEPKAFASNGYGDLSPGKHGMDACFLAEILLTFFFLMIMGTACKGAATGLAGIPIGLAVTLTHLVPIPVTDTSVNPARGTGPALFAGGAYVGQFWLAPVAGAMAALTRCRAAGQLRRTFQNIMNPLCIPVSPRNTVGT